MQSNAVLVCNVDTARDKSVTQCDMIWEDVMWHCDIVTCTDTQTPLGIATTSNRLKHATFDSLLSPLSVTPIQKATFGAFKQHRIQTDCHITSRIGILKSREAHALSRNRQLPTVQPSRRKQRTSKKKKSMEKGSEKCFAGSTGFAWIRILNWASHSYFFFGFVAKNALNASGTKAEQQELL